MPQRLRKRSVKIRSRSDPTHRYFLGLEYQSICPFRRQATWFTITIHSIEQIPIPSIEADHHCPSGVQKEVLLAKRGMGHHQILAAFLDREPRMIQNQHLSDPTAIGSNEQPSGDDARLLAIVQTRYGGLDRY
jgi:hypothetical protein